jgi:ferredoxin
MAARVNEQMCIECGKCVKTCPVNAITLLTTETGPSDRKDPQTRPAGTVDTHVHDRRQHESGLIGRFWGRGHVHRGR